MPARARQQEHLIFKRKFSDIRDAASSGGKFQPRFLVYDEHHSTPYLTETDMYVVRAYHVTIFPQKFARIC